MDVAESGEPSSKKVAEKQPLSKEVGKGRMGYPKDFKIPFNLTIT